MTESENVDNKMMIDAVCNNENPPQSLQQNTNESSIDHTEDNGASYNNNVNSYQANKQQPERKLDSKLQCLGTRIDEDVLKAFRLHVLNKYGRLNKVFSWEVQAALAHYLECNRKQKQTTDYSFSNGEIKKRSDVKSRYQQIANEFLRIKSFPNFSAETIKKTIWGVIGEERDERTFKSYLAVIKKQSKEKPSGFGIYHVFDVSKFCETTLGISLNTVEKVSDEGEEDDSE